MGALRDFVADVLEIEGAAVEPLDPDGLDIVAPEPLRSAIGWPEFIRLGFGAVLPGGATPIGFEGEWLDRFGGLSNSRGIIKPHRISADIQIDMKDITGGAGNSGNNCDVASSQHIHQAGLSRVRLPGDDDFQSVSDNFPVG